MNIEQTKEYLQLCECYGVKAKSGIDENSEPAMFYPDFTPQKQLELIKFISGLTMFYCIHREDGIWICLGDDPRWVIEGKDKNFELALIKLLTEIADFEIDHAKVKEILEG